RYLLGFVAGQLAPGNTTCRETFGCRGSAETRARRLSLVRPLSICGARCRRRGLHAAERWVRVAHRAPTSTITGLWSLSPFHASSPPTVTRRIRRLHAVGMKQ